MTAERASWRKVWASFYSSPSHVGLDALALHVGAVVIVHASWDRQQSDAVLLDGAGLPMSHANLARLARVPVKVAKRCLDDLVRVGTLKLDGVTVILSRFQRWQESEAAARMRRVRNSSNEPPNGAPHSDAKVPTKQRQEAEAEAEAEQVSGANAPSSKTPAGPDVPDQPLGTTSRWNATARRIWEAHEAMRVEHGIGRHRGFNATARSAGTAAIRALVEHVRKREQCDEDAAVVHVLAKLERGCQDCAAGRIDRAWVNGPTAWRTSSYDAATDSAVRPAPKPDLREVYAAELARQRGQA